MIKIVDGQIADNYSSLMRPPKGYDNFDPWNIAIHGITPNDVRESKRFENRWPEILKFIGDFPVVAHNAGFDIGVMREALRVSDITWPDLRYACTMVMSRRVYEIPSHTLSLVAEAAGVAWDEDLHHNAKYDALIAAQIVISMARNRQCETLDELLNSVAVGYGLLKSDRWVGCQAKHPSSSGYASHAQSVKDVEINLRADETHPIYGKRIVFTGTLHSMPRFEAWKVVASFGGIPQNDVTAETNILVMGEQELIKLKPGATKSSKVLKAEMLKSKGSDIEVFTERDFLSQMEAQSGGKSG